MGHHAFQRHTLSLSHKCVKVYLDAHVGACARPNVPLAAGFFLCCHRVAACGTTAHGNFEGAGDPTALRKFREFTLEAVRITNTPPNEHPVSGPCCAPSEPTAPTTPAEDPCLGLSEDPRSGGTDHGAPCQDWCGSEVLAGKRRRRSRALPAGLTQRLGEGGGAAGRLDRATLRCTGSSGHPILPSPPVQPKLALCTSCGRSRWCLGFNFCVALRKLPVITAAERKQSPSTEALQLCQLLRTAGRGCRVHAVPLARAVAPGVAPAVTYSDQRGVCGI